MVSTVFDGIARHTPEGYAFAARARYFEGVRAAGTAPLSKIRQETASDGWYKIASGKGMLVLAELRRTLGDATFLDMMDKFGRDHAGKPATTADFISAASAAAGKDLAGFFDFYRDEVLPILRTI